MRSYGVIHTAFSITYTIRQLSAETYLGQGLYWGFERVSKGFLSLAKTLCSRGHSGKHFGSTQDEVAAV